MSFNQQLAIAATAAAFSLVGCQANSGAGDASGDARYSGSRPVLNSPNDGSLLDGLLSDNTNIPFPNDGSVTSEIMEGEQSLDMKFVCEDSVSVFEGAQIELGANGLVGGLVGGLLNLLSGDSLSSLLNSLEDSTLALDNDLNTAAAVTQTLSGLGGLLNSVDVTIDLPAGTTNPDGAYAVAAISLPGSLLELGLLSTVRVVTLLNGETQEDNAVLSTSSLSLLGLSTNDLADRSFAFVGYKTTKPFDAVRLELGAQLLSLDVGPSVYIHELCTDGDLVADAN